MPTQQNCHENTCLNHLNQLTLNRQHLYVNPQLDSSCSKPFCYRSIHEAAAAVCDGTMEHPSVIYIEPDVYWANGTESSVGLVINKNWITLQGLGEHPEDVVIADARGHMVNCHPADNTANSPAQTMIVNGDGFHTINLTIGNYLNLDLEYPLNPSKSRKKVSDVITQAYALGSIKQYDFWMFENCRLIGMLDTLAFYHRRVYFRDSLIEGTKDFIGGGACAVFDHCEIRIHDTCPMYTAGDIATLYRNCRFFIQLEDFDTLYLTKFGGQLILDHCDFYGNAKHLEWELEPKRDARCYYRELRLNGESVHFSTDTPKNSVQITEEMEDSFSFYNMLCGNDGWNPSGTDKVSPLPICIRIAPVPPINYGQTVTTEVTLLPAVRKEELQITCHGPVSCVLEDTSLHLKGTNHSLTPAEAEITVSCHGVHGVCTVLSLGVVSAQPSLAAVPDFTIQDGTITFNYKLTSLKSEDCSDITWYRSSDQRVLAVSRELPCRNYRLVPSDIGSSIEVCIVPNVRISRGTESYRYTSRVITEADLNSSSICIDDFRSFPVLPQPMKKNDFFIDAYRPSYRGTEVKYVADWMAGKAEDAWKYGRGHDGAKAYYGLIASARGASLQYRKGTYSKGVRVTAVFCPDKDTGEGFGSANGQYLELLIKYDAVTRTGYGLRIERIPYFANGCAFSLRKYDDGINECISNTVLSSAFMPPCMVHLEASNGILSLHVETGWKSQPSMAKRKGYPHQVDLTAPYEENGYGDIEIHHTGTVPIGNQTLISKLSIEYESCV